MQGIEMLTFIVPRESGNRLLALCRERGIDLSVVMHGRGIASSEVVNTLAIGDTERDVVLLTAGSDGAFDIMRELCAMMHLERTGTGIAFSIPLSAAADQLSSYKLLCGRAEARAEKQNESQQQGGGKMESIKHDLTITIVDRGYADDVIAAAKEAGAFGGTVINARGTGSHELHRFFGTVLEPEKEAVLILTEREKRNGIMEAICRKAGLSKQGMGICFSLPVDRVAGIKRFETADASGPADLPDQLR